MLIDNGLAAQPCPWSPFSHPRYQPLPASFPPFGGRQPPAPAAMLISTSN